MEEKSYVASIRLPTDQFAYIEVEAEGTPTELMEAYNSLKNAYTGGEGLPDKDWQRVLDRYFWDDGSMEMVEYTTMSKVQQAQIQEIKKSRKRKDYKLPE